MVRDTWKTFDPSSTAATRWTSWIYSWFGNTPERIRHLNKDIFQLSVEDLEPYEQVIFLAGLSERSDGKIFAKPKLF